MSYLVRDGGEVECPNQPPEKHSGRTPFRNTAQISIHRRLLRGGRFYAPREDGMVFVANVAGDKFRVLSQNDLQEPVIGSPIPVDGRIYLRGERHLFCFGTK
ncbi:MAG UNVERIFIED_CONTAM: hypothetical protein LVR18_46630 [Planctomycetaceae bacterium]|jgi:outer membrane protein assembly factor BamB